MHFVCNQYSVNIQLKITYIPKLKLLIYRNYLRDILVFYVVFIDWKNDFIIVNLIYIVLIYWSNFLYICYYIILYNYSICFVMGSLFMDKL